MGEESEREIYCIAYDDDGDDDRQQQQVVHLAVA